MVLLIEAEVTGIVLERTSLPADVMTFITPTANVRASLHSQVAVFAHTHVYESVMRIAFDTAVLYATVRGEMG